MDKDNQTEECGKGDESPLRAIKDSKKKISDIKMILCSFFFQFVNYPNNNRKHSIVSSNALTSKFISLNAAASVTSNF